MISNGCAPTGTLYVSVVNTSQLEIQNTDTIPHCVTFSSNSQTNNTEKRSDVCFHCFSSEEEKKKSEKMSLILLLKRLLKEL